MQRRLKLKPAAAETRLKATRKIVFFHQQHARAALKQTDRGDQSAVARADDDGIKFFHVYLLYYPFRDTPLPAALISDRNISDYLPIGLFRNILRTVIIIIPNLLFVNTRMRIIL